jgi:hypothetical protein
MQTSKELLGRRTDEKKRGWDCSTCTLFNGDVNAKKCRLWHATKPISPQHPFELHGLHVPKNSPDEYFLRMLRQGKSLATNK